MNEPNLLVISNNSLSNNISNGRTLSGILYGWDKNKIAQIYVSGEAPQSEVCDNFFRITDKDILKGFLHPYSIGSKVKNELSFKKQKPEIKKIKKTVFTITARDFIWNTGIWYNKKLKKWLEEFKPQAILFLTGESTFTFKMTLKIAKEYGIPIITFNSEGYYFKEKNYLKDSGISSLMYPIYHRAFVRTFNKFMKNTKYIIQLNNKLKNDYDLCFDVPSIAQYASTNVKKATVKPEHKIPQVSYLGNLGVGRHTSLCEIADALQEINRDYHLDVYGKIPNDEVKKAFENCIGINYKGVVSYNDVVKIMHESDLLVHAEGFNDFCRWDLKYAFTTKIADSLACGTCFFVYAPEELACTEYLKNITCVVTDRAELKEKLSELLGSKELQQKYISASLKAAEKNHRTDVNCKKFKEILNEVLEADYESASN